MSEIFGAAGQIASAAISAGAIKDATQMQIDALNKQRDFVYNQLNPDVVGGMASSADVQRAKDRLALQGITDPELLKQRYAAQDKLSGQLAGIGGGGASDVAGAATKEAIAGLPGMKEAQ